MKSEKNYFGIMTVLCFALLNIILLYNPSHAFDENMISKTGYCNSCLIGRSHVQDKVSFCFLIWILIK